MFVKLRIFVVNIKYICTHYKQYLQIKLHWLIFKIVTHLHYHLKPSSSFYLIFCQERHQNSITEVLSIRSTFPLTSLNVFTKRKPVPPDTKQTNIRGNLWIKQWTKKKKKEFFFFMLMTTGWLISSADKPSPTDAVAIHTIQQP